MTYANLKGKPRYIFCVPSFYDITLTPLTPPPQLILQRKLGRAPVDDEDGDGQEEGQESQSSPVSAGTIEAKSPIHLVSSNSGTPTPPSSATPTKRDSTASGVLQCQNSTESMNWSRERRRSSRRVKRSSISRKFSNTSSSSRTFSNASTLSEVQPGGGTAGMVGRGVAATKEVESDEELLRPEWALDQIELSDSDSEYFDAQGKQCL